MDHISPQSRGTSRSGSPPSSPTHRKSRGRPMMDTKVADAEDRRRTQIRLAQRAYRQRKEATLAQLRDKVARLEGTITQISSAFTEMNEELRRTQALRARPDLARQLTETQRAIAVAVSEVEGQVREEQQFQQQQQQQQQQVGSKRVVDDSIAEELRTVEIWGYRVVRD